MMDKNMGCTFRRWDWHDGGPDHRCIKDGKKNTCCDDSWSDWFVCDEMKEVVSKMFPDQEKPD